MVPYSQDQVNGFDETLIADMLDLIALGPSMILLDAMAGDGNLSLRIFQYCERKALPLPSITLLESSPEQCDLACEKLSRYPTLKIVCGDVLKMEAHDGSETLFPKTFDRVAIKSGNHEIPKARQPLLYQKIHDVLKPGGLFINLGALFEEEEERDEFHAIIRAKDRLASLHHLVENRYPLIRKELYAYLDKAGFCSVRCGKHFEYVHRSDRFAEQYFPEENRAELELEFQQQQIRARCLRLREKIIFQGLISIMTAPGEITVAQRGDTCAGK